MGCVKKEYSFRCQLPIILNKRIKEKGQPKVNIIDSKKELELFFSLVFLLTANKIYSWLIAD